MEWSIQDIARSAGTTSRTLRHYGELGLLPPSRVGSNGYRYYDQDSLVRLQRILLLRELGLSLPMITEVLDGQRDTAAALRTHLELLEQQRRRIGRQIESVRTTLRKTEEGEELMAAEVFDGFDHTKYEQEVTQRWGKETYQRGDRWWRGLGADGRQAHLDEQIAIGTALAQAAAAGQDPGEAEVQAIVARHYDWVVAGWQGRRPTAEQFRGLGEMYVQDERFTVNYEKFGTGVAEFIRDAMAVYADRLR
ncbi:MULTISPECIES: MerR family transcriptional regulator [unclassified Crossiella]|uniref:MerR family transcriptional regulator n=1 Tax=unclassified Crossiella TaxID=2620835 RepID=UPI001FFE3DB7|nr:MULTISPECIES: MerR family transcriptional regulator [unclassified Crossiella]MCK2240173.1 MerR family transcriptional regulator [Crossiella sp. S99.2]MCK2253375.1 MerR family transcriptional regulator [Crossiella sp. S99.1]